MDTATGRIRPPPEMCIRDSAPAEYHKGGQLDQGEPNGCPQDCSQGNVQAVADDPQAGETRRDQADQLGQEDSGGQADGKHEGAVSYLSLIHILFESKGGIFITLSF